MPSTLSSSWTVLVVTILLSSFILLTSGANGNEIYENRGIKSANGGEEMKAEKDKREFFLGSRYGRSQSDLTNMDDNGKAVARIAPRNDRFFFGSRYGKRSSPVMAVDEDQNRVMSCFYTGITNLFRCVEKVDVQLNLEENK